MQKSWARDAFRCLGSFFMQTAFEFEMKTLTGATDANAHAIYIYTYIYIYVYRSGYWDMRQPDSPAGLDVLRCRRVQKRCRCLCRCILFSVVRLLSAN